MNNIEVGDVVVFSGDSMPSVIVEVAEPAVHAAWILQEKSGEERLSYPGTRLPEEIELRVGRWTRSRIITGLVNQLCGADPSPSKCQEFTDTVSSYLEEVK